MGLAANYVTKTIPQLPNFFATRATTRFEDTPLVQKPGGFIPYEPLHQVGTSSVTVLYRDGREVDEPNQKVKTTTAQGLTTSGANSAPSSASSCSMPRRASWPGAIGNRGRPALRPSSATKYHEKNRTTK